MFSPSELTRFIGRLPVIDCLLNLAVRSAICDVYFKYGRIGVLQEIAKNKI